MNDYYEVPKKAGIIYVRLIANNFIVAGQERLCRKTGRPLSTQSRVMQLLQSADSSCVKNDHITKLLAS